MLNIFYRQNGKIALSQSEKDFAKIALENTVWIDLVDPSGAEKRAVESFLGTEIQSRAQAEEIESSSRYFETDDAIFANTNFLTPGAEEYSMQAVSFTLVDDTLTTLLLALTILTFIAYSNIRGFFTRQVKNFFRPPLDGTTTVRDTLTEVRFQGFIVFLTSVLFATLYYFYALHYIGDTYILDSQYYLIAIFCAIFLLYLVLKVWLYSFVNWVFFDGKRNGQWIRSLSFLISLEGLLAYPAILMGPYLNVPIQNVEIYFAIGLILVKLMTFYKCYVIFFRQNVVGLQIILYLCALEIVPLLALWKVLYITANSLKINF